METKTTMTPAPKAIALLRPDKAGDALKTLPVLRALFAELPATRLHLVASDHNASLFVHEPGVQLHVLPRNWKRMKRDNWLAALALPRDIDAVVNLLCDASEDADELMDAIPTSARYTAALARSRVSASPDGFPTGYAKLSLPESTPAGRAETENIALLVSQALGRDLATAAARFPAAPIFGPADEAEAQEKMGRKEGPWLGFCPFAGTTQRTPPVKRWERFIPRATQAREARPFEKYFLFGTPADYSKLERLRSLAASPERVELCFPSSFRALGAYLKRLDGVVAVDSGPLHLARSLGIRSLGILSGGDTERWFSPVPEGDMLLRRGFFNRFPSAIEMMWAFEKWGPLAATGVMG